MAIPTLHLPLEENLEGRDRNGLTVATATGAVRWVDGPRTERKWVTPLLVASPDHTEDRQGPLTPHLSSSVTLGQGTYGKTWKLKKANTPPSTLMLSPSANWDQTGERTEVYEETVNLYPNPSMDPSGAIPYTDGFRRQFDSSEAYTGTTSLRMSPNFNTQPQPYAFFATDYGAVHDSQLYSISFYVKSNRPMVNWFLTSSFRNSVGTVIGTAQFLYRINTTEEWSRVTWTIPVTPKNASFVAFSFRQGREALQTDDVIWIDAVQIEAKPYVTPYIDGDMPEGTWTGTPHASTSARVRGSAMIGAVRPTQINGMGGWFFEEGTTNLLWNPSLAVSGTYWSKSGTTSTQRVVCPWNPAVYAMEARPTTGTAVSLRQLEDYAPDGVNRINVSEGEQYTYSITVYSESTGSARVWAYVRDTSGAASSITLANNVPTIAGTPTRVVATMTIPAGIAHIYILGIDINGTTGGTPFYVAEPQFEKKPYATSYCDGSLGAGYSWTGSPNASPSVRTKGTVEIPFTNQVTQESGAVYAWITFPEIAQGAYPIAIGGTTGLLFGIHSNGRVNGYLGSAVQNIGTTEVTTPPRDTPVLVGLEWDSSTAYITYNDKVVGVMSRSSTTVSFGSTILVGYYGTSEPRPSIVHGVAMFPKRLSDAERMYLYQNRTWTWDSLNEVDGEVIVGHEATTNLVTNPAFTIDASGWGMASGSIERSTERSFHGPASGLATSSGSLPRTSYSFTAPTKPHYAQAWVWHDLGPYRDFYLFMHALGGSVTGPTVAVPRRVWTPVGAAFTGAGTSGSAQIRMPNSVTGEQFYVGHFQIEERPYATGLCPRINDEGAITEGFVWNGDPHNSTSTRTARGDVNSTKNTLVRYLEDGEYKTVRLEGRAGAIGTKGRFTTWDGSLRLYPNGGSTLEVENIVLYDHDVSQIEPQVSTTNERWSLDNTSAVMHVPLKVPFIEEGTTNLCTNPLVETSDASNAGYTTNRERIPSVWNTHGRTVLKVTTAGGVSFQGSSYATQANLELTGARTFTGSAYVWGTDRVRIRLDIRYTDGTTTQSAIAATDTALDKPTRLEVTVTSLSNKTVRQLFLYVGSHQPSIMDVYSDAVQIEEKPYASTFCPQFDEFGELRDGYTWQGAAYASPSVRATSGLLQRFDQDALQGSAVARYMIQTDKSPTVYVLMFGDIGATSTTLTGFAIWYQPSNGSVWLRADNNQRYVYGTPARIGEWQTVYLAWDATTVHVDFNDGAGLQSYPRHSAGSTQWRDGGSVAFGRRPTTVTDTYAAQIAIGGFLLFDRPLTEKERTTLLSVESWEWDTLFPTPERVIRRASPSPIGIIRRNGDNNS